MAMTQKPQSGCCEQSITAAMKMATFLVRLYKTCNHSQTQLINYKYSAVSCFRCDCQSIPSTACSPTATHA